MTKISTRKSELIPSDGFTMVLVVTLITLDFSSRSAKYFEVF